MQVTDHLGTSMTNVSPVCTKCGSKLFADAPQGFCSLCLFKTGLGSLQDEDEDALGSSAARMQMEFGDYKLLEEIGRGGQGVVYRAHQKSLNRTVALKVIGLGQWATKTHLKRFRLEAEAAASLEHPGIVPIHEVGEREGTCYFSMGFIEGDQLDAVVRREPMSVRRAAELIAKVARTVHYAHEHHILHRDIKPGNILLDQEGEPHLTDFGLARLVETEGNVTRTMEVLGTPSYMAPEQAVGNNACVTGATDVYGLGAVLYQSLTGHPPFAGGTTFETVRLVLDTEPRQPRLLNPKIDRDLNTICLKCLDKDPQRRYASALALAEDLERWLKHEPIRARRTGIFTRGRKWLRRNPSIAVMAALLLAFAVPLGVMIWKTESERSLLSNPAPPEKSIAVLPFSNLSKEQENAFFTDGVQDEILTDLAKVADLKVISRTSVMPYKSGMPRNVRVIGQQLGVAHVVEGSVQRSSNRVRVNAQLVDARTVHYAHEHHILHRDIKPGNILLDRQGEPHLTDFGLARLVETESTVTRTMEVLGTPSYMAPEQAVGDDAAITSATDVYGLGAVLYQLLTGHPPFAGGTTFETVRLVLDTEPRQPRLLNPKIDRDLNTICLKCLDKDPQRRYASALALAEDLERWLKHEPIRARRTGLFTRGRKWLRRSPSIAVMAAMLLVFGAKTKPTFIWPTASRTRY